MQDTLNILLPEASDSDFIEHHGVKGMHWGVRKERKAAALRNRNEHLRKNLKVKNLTNSLNTYGERGVKRISKNVDKGLTLEQAKLKEEKHQKRLRVAGNIAKGTVKTAAKVGLTVGAGYVLSPIIAEGFRQYAKELAKNTSFYQISKKPPIIRDIYEYGKMENIREFGNAYEGALRKGFKAVQGK